MMSPTWGQGFSGTDGRMMAARTGRKRADIDVKVYERAQMEAGMLGVSTSWLIGGLVGDVLNGTKGPATVLVEARRATVEAQKRADAERFAASRRPVDNVKSSQAPRGRR